MRSNDVTNLVKIMRETVEGIDKLSPRDKLKPNTPEHELIESWRVILAQYDASKKKAEEDRGSDVLYGPKANLLITSDFMRVAQEIFEEIKGERIVSILKDVYSRGIARGVYENNFSRQKQQEEQEKIGIQLEVVPQEPDTKETVTTPKVRFHQNLNCPQCRAPFPQRTRGELSIGVGNRFTCEWCKRLWRIEEIVSG